MTYEELTYRYDAIYHDRTTDIPKEEKRWTFYETLYEIGLLGFFVFVYDFELPPTQGGNLDMSAHIVLREVVKDEERLIAESLTIQIIGTHSGHLITTHCKTFWVNQWTQKRTKIEHCDVKIGEVEKGVEYLRRLPITKPAGM
jgi:hypothetical protein